MNSGGITDMIDSCWHYRGGVAGSESPSLYFRSVDLVSCVLLLPLAGQPVNGQSTDAIGRGLFLRGELPLFDSGADT